MLCHRALEGVAHAAGDLFFVRKRRAPFFYLCSYVLIIAVPFAHVTSIDHYTPCWGCGGVFAQFLYKRCSASRRSKARCEVRVSNINMNRACAAQSSQSLFQSKKFPQRHSRGASLTLSGQHAQSVSRRNQLPPVRYVIARQRKFRTGESFQRTRDSLPDAYAPDTSGVRDAAMPPMSSRFEEASSPCDIQRGIHQDKPCDSLISG